VRLLLLIYLIAVPAAALAGSVKLEAGRAGLESRCHRCHAIGLDDASAHPEAPPLRIHPRLREYGEAAPRGPLPKVRERNEERALLARQLAEEHRQIEAARTRLATGRRTRLSEFGQLDPHAFALLLSLLGEALTAQASPDETIERQSGDGLLSIRLEPMGAHTRAEVSTDAGVFAGRDHHITITATPDIR